MVTPTQTIGVGKEMLITIIILSVVVYLETGMLIVKNYEKWNKLFEYSSFENAGYAITFWCWPVQVFSLLVFHGVASMIIAFAVIYFFIKSLPKAIHDGKMPEKWLG